MCVIQLLSGYFLVTKHDSSYKEEVSRYFAPHANHPAVALFKTMSKKGFAFSEVPDAMLSLTPPPELAPRTAFHANVIKAAGDEAQLLRFVEAARDFANVSGFMRFYANHESFYQGLADRTRPAVSPVIGQLEAYTGTPTGNATVILGPLLHDGGFAAVYELPNRDAEAYAFIGPKGSLAGSADFGDSGRIGGLVAHEFAHLVVNPLTARHLAVVDSHSGRFPALKEAMRKNGYGDWPTIVSEHIIRAITTRLVHLNEGAEAGAKAQAEELKRGFVYVPALMATLEAYERHRAKYRTLADYYPALLAVFRNEITAPS